MHTRKTTRPRLPLAALGVLLLSGCGNRAELVQFNDRVARAFKSLAEADRLFYDGVYDFAYGKVGPDGAGLKRFHDGYDSLKREAAAVRKEAEGLKVPDAPGARRFYDSLLKVLKVHEGILDEFASARGASKRRALAERVRLREMLDEAQRRKRAAWTELDEAQRDFARENGITVK